MNSRKFGLVVFIELASIGLLLADKITPSIWEGVTVNILLYYAAANVAQKIFVKD